MYKVTVLDTQPIMPAVGGGRLRLLGLYHDLGPEFKTTYIGSYDWPGEKYRRHHLSKTLEEIDVPLSNEHFDQCAQLQKQADGKIIIDSSFNLFAHLSPQFIELARANTELSDVVVFSHPWLYPSVKDSLRKRTQLVVYDSQNVEGLLRASLLNGNEIGTEIANNVKNIEGDLCRDADLILACSHEDRKLFHKIYNIPFSKIAVVPNGAFTDKILKTDEILRLKARKKINIGNVSLAVFVGSSYGPNIEAARFIIDTLAPALPHVQFAICGGVSNEFSQRELDNKNISNVILTGSLNEDDKLAYLAAADVAINPMFSGSGTNIKMFDFMAAGLPIVATHIGARGIFQWPEKSIIVCSPEEFGSNVQRIIDDKKYSDILGNLARQAVERKYSWPRISRDLGRLLHRRREKINQPQPFFSIIIPTFERHENLEILMDFIRAQSFQNFEVIIIDQSKVPWKNAHRYSELDLFYVHTDIVGAVAARNTATFYACGQVLAFIDDDCQPKADWLENGIKYFDDGDIVGVEGFISSDHLYDGNYRVVTNIGHQAGYRTANLMVKREIFMAVDGFDESFDRPHFREDTDLGWRVCEYGKIPFAKDVCVHHPAHLRSDKRESEEERNKFFEKDVLLMKKHPERYRELFLFEPHYKFTPGFLENLLRGAKKYDVEIDTFYLSAIAKAYRCSKKDTIQISYVGSSGISSRIHTILSVFRVLAKQYKNISLNLVGDFYFETNSIIDFIKINGFEDRVAIVEGSSNKANVCILRSDILIDSGDYLVGQQKDYNIPIILSQNGQPRGYFHDTIFEIPMNLDEKTFLYFFLEKFVTDGDFRIYCASRDGAL